MTTYKTSISAALLADVAVASFLQSCTYKNEEELFPQSDCDVSMVTYSGHIVPLLDNYCTGCHGSSEPSGGVVLDNFDDVQGLALNGNLYCSVNHDDGCSQMPQDQPKIPECDILTLKTWIDDGAPNN